MKHFLLITALCMALLSCERDAELIHIENLNGDSISVFGHGGMGSQFVYPINSWESIGNCLESGADGTEIDVQVTRDSVAVAFHHTDLDDATICNGIVHDKLWSEIESCSHDFPWLPNVKMQRLDELFARIGEPGKRIFTLDCKLYTSSPDHIAYKSQFANAVIKTVNDLGLQHNVFIESDDTSFLGMMQEREPALKLFIYAPFPKGLAIAEQMGLYGITIANDAITKDQVKLAHSKGIRVTVFGMTTDQENFDAIEKSPDFTQSDRIIHLLKIFRKYKS